MLTPCPEQCMPSPAVQHASRAIAGMCPPAAAVDSPLRTQIDRCFGFDTAVEEAQRALLAAKVEASSAFKGIGLVKLMGRQSGFIAMQASMASGVVDVCLIPEVRAWAAPDSPCQRCQGWPAWQRCQCCVQQPPWHGKLTQHSAAVGQALCAA